jgi:surface antigen
VKFKKKFSILLIVLLIILASAIYEIDKSRIGNEIDSYKNVYVYYNGIVYFNSYGKNYSQEGYYFGQKWQCVEFIKRFYFIVKHHQMPDGYGHAKDFYDENTNQGKLNIKRNLLQFKNGENVGPKPDDIVVFTDTKYGHVAIVTEVDENHIVIIQQNIWGKPREQLSLTKNEGKFLVGAKRKPTCWLRKPS